MSKSFYEDGELPDDIAAQLEKPKRAPRRKRGYLLLIAMILVGAGGLTLLLMSSGPLRQWLPGATQPLRLSSAEEVNQLPDCAIMPAPAVDILVFNVQLFQIPRGFSSIVRTTTTGRNPCLLTRNPLWNSAPAISPDGKRVAYISTVEDSMMRVINLMNIDGTNVSQITEPMDSVAQIDWSPDGTQFVFSAQDGTETQHIYSIGLDGGMKNLTASTGADAYPVWSPDGTSVMFVSTFDYTRSEALPPNLIAIYVMKPDGSNIVKLAAGVTADWMPDGQQIVYIPPEGGIHIISITGQNDRLILDYPGDEISVLPSFDGKQIYFASVNQHSPAGVYTYSDDTVSTIYQVDVETKQAAPVVVTTGGFIFTVSIWTDEQP